MELDYYKSALDKESGKLKEK
jgi:hypothetical protein